MALPSCASGVGHQTMTLFDDRDEVLLIDLTGTMVWLDAVPTCQEEQICAAATVPILP